MTGLDIDQARERARSFVAFCDGLEEGGWPTFARRGRVVADDLLLALHELEGERSARRSIQEARDRALALLLKPAGPEREDAARAAAGIVEPDP